MGKTYRELKNLGKSKKRRKLVAEPKELIRIYPFLLAPNRNRKLLFVKSETYNLFSSKLTRRNLLCVKSLTSLSQISLIQLETMLL